MFVGVGGYTTLLLLHHLKLTPLLGIPLGGLISAGLAWQGGPTLRLSGHYFAMATIALLQIGLLLMINWDWAGGAVGWRPRSATRPGCCCSAARCRTTGSPWAWRS